MPNRMTLEEVSDALVRLTPGGSEFHDSPKNCLTWIEDRVSMTGKLAAQRNRYRKAGDELAAAAVNARQSVIGDKARDRLDASLRRWREATS